MKLTFLIKLIQSNFTFQWNQALLVSVILIAIGSFASTRFCLAQVTGGDSLFSSDMYGDSCNESICGSIVSKCLLTQSCKCDSKTNITCSKDCFYCLDFLYHECCACVEMCPKPNHTDFASSVTSHVEDLTEASPELFQVLTEEQDRLQRWISLTYPINLSFIGTTITQDEDDASPVKMPQVNCTVAYMSQCMSWNKCKSSCLSMGANSYRWFHDGCCECVGTNCVNYGLNEAKCLHCPFKDGSSPPLYMQPNVTEVDTDSESATRTDSSSLPVS